MNEDSIAKRIIKTNKNAAIAIYNETRWLELKYNIKEIPPKKDTTIRGKNLSIKVAAATCKTDFSLIAKPRLKYSPILAGVKIPAANP